MERGGEGGLTARGGVFNQDCNSSTGESRILNDCVPVYIRCLMRKRLTARLPEGVQVQIRRNLYISIRGLSRSDEKRERQKKKQELLNR